MERWTRWTRWTRWNSLKCIERSIRVVYRIEWHLQRILVRSEYTQHSSNGSLNIGKKVYGTDTEVRTV